MLSDLHRHGWAGDRYAACSYSWISPVPCQNSHTASELVFLCSSGCSPVLADQAVDDLPAFDPRGNVDRLAGLVQRRSLFARLVRPLLVVVLCVLGQDPVPLQNSTQRL